MVAQQPQMVGGGEAEEGLPHAARVDAVAAGDEFDAGFVEPRHPDGTCGPLARAGRSRGRGRPTARQACRPVDRAALMTVTHLGFAYRVDRPVRASAVVGSGAGTAGRPGWGCVGDVCSAAGRGLSGEVTDGSLGDVVDRARGAGRQAAASPASISRLPRAAVVVRCSCRTKTPRKEAARGSARLRVPTAAALVEGMRRRTASTPGRWWPAPAER